MRAVLSVIDWVVGGAESSRCTPGPLCNILNRIPRRPAIAPPMGHGRHGGAGRHVERGGRWRARYRWMANGLSHPSVPCPKAAEKAEIQHGGVRNRRTASASAGPSLVTVECHTKVNCLCPGKFRVCSESCLRIFWVGHKHVCLGKNMRNMSI